MADITIDGTTIGANRFLLLDSTGKIPAVDGSQVTAIAAGNIATGTIPIARIDTGSTANKIVVLDGSGRLPAVSGALLTGVSSSTKSASDPTISTNPSGGVGTEWHNTTTGEAYICTDATAGANVWTNIGAGSGDVLPLTWMGGRGLCLGGYNGPAGGYKDIIDYWTIATTGNAIDFGNLTSNKIEVSACSGGTRGVLTGGYKNSPSGTTNEIEYITIATPGNAVDFGDMTTDAGSGNSSLSNGGRGIRGGGYASSSPGNTNTLDYFTIATPGNAIDFGDMTTIKEGAGPMSGTTRGVWGGGKSTTEINIIEYVTIATPGNGTDFGDLTETRRGCNAAANETRGVCAGGYPYTVTMDYITIATTGNAIDFGDILASRGFMTNGNVNSTTRGCFAGGHPSEVNIIQYITIATTGNAIDFGDLTVGRYTPAGTAGD